MSHPSHLHSTISARALSHLRRARRAPARRLSAGLLGVFLLLGLADGLPSQMTAATQPNENGPTATDPNVTDDN
jgi:hypothetical protein